MKERIPGLRILDSVHQRLGFDEFCPWAGLAVGVVPVFYAPLSRDGPRESPVSVDDFVVALRLGAAGVLEPFWTNTVQTEVSLSTTAARVQEEAGLLGLNLQYQVTS